MTSSYKLLACGSNGSGQLGLGHDDDQSVLQPVLFSESWGQIEQISGGGNHTLVLLQDGRLLVSGKDNQGQVGVRTEESYLHTFQEFPALQRQKWLKIACGWEFSILVDQDHNLFSCGLGSKGELGLGKNIMKSFKPDEKNILKPIEFEHGEIVDIKASLDHVILRTSSGDFYGWGYNKLGKLSLSLPKKVWIPTKLDLPKDLKEFVVGREYSIFYGENKIIGRGNIKRLEEDGLSTFNANNIVQMKSMWSSIHVETIDDDDKMIYSFGNNSHSQKFQNLQNLNKNQIKIKKFAVGSEHGIVLTEGRNDVYSWGWGEHGNCGTKKYANENNEEEDSTTFGLLNLLYQGDKNNEGVYLMAGGCATTFIGIFEKSNK